MKCRPDPAQRKARRGFASIRPARAAHFFIGPRGGHVLDVAISACRLQAESVGQTELHLHVPAPALQFNRDGPNVELTRCEPNKPWPQLCHLYRMTPSERITPFEKSEPTMGMEMLTDGLPYMAKMAAILSEENRVLPRLIRARRTISLPELTGPAGREVPNPLRTLGIMESDGLVKLKKNVREIAPIEQATDSRCW